MHIYMCVCVEKERGRENEIDRESRIFLLCFALQFLPHEDSLALRLEGIQMIHVYSYAYIYIYIYIY